MYGLTNASKGAQDPVTQTELNNAVSSCNTYTDNNKGYKVVTNTEDIAWNSEYRYTYTNLSGNVTINLPVVPNPLTQTMEFRCIVYFNCIQSQITSFVFASATGQTQNIIWPDENASGPSWSAGKIYEISFSPLYDAGSTYYIVGYAKEISLT